MKTYQLTNRAEHDLIDIFSYGIEQFGLIQAQNYSIELADCFDLIAKNPHIGREAKSIAKNVRRHEHKSHTILYEQTEFGVLILALVHSRNISKLVLD